MIWAALGQLMAQSQAWLKEFRTVIKASIGSGWTVENDRGNMRLIHGNKKEGRTSINLHYAWENNQFIEALKFIEEGANTYLENNGKIPLKTVFKYARNSSFEVKLDWEGALVRYREERSDIKETTWTKKYLPIFEGVMFYMNRANHRTQNARALY